MATQATQVTNNCKLELEWWGADVVICLGRGVNLHVAQLMPLPLSISCSSKSRLVLPFWYWLTWVVLDNTHTHTHTTVLLLVWNMSGSTRVSRYQKGKNQEG